jgi:exopolysaccharide production protein ExoZ
LTNLPKYRTLQAARGLAALLVVVCHASSFVGREPGLWQRSSVYLWFRGGALGVQMFFVLSGIVIFTAHRNDIDNPSTVRSFLYKRFRRIYPLYWIFYALTVVRHSAGTDLAYQRNPWVITSGILLVHLFSVQTNMVVAWTLFDEVLFYLFFSLLLLNKRLGIIALTLWLAASLLFLTPSGSYWSTIFSPNHLLFALGIFIAWRLEKQTPPYAKVIFWAGAAIFSICVVAAGHLTGEPIAMQLIAGIGASFTLFGAAEMERQGRLSVPNWLVFLGDASYSIYLSHFMVVSAVARIGYSHLHQLPIPIAVWMVALILCGTCAGILTYLFIERPLLSKLGWRHSL